MRSGVVLARAGLWFLNHRAPILCLVVGQMLTTLDTSATPSGNKKVLNAGARPPAHWASGQ